MPEPKKLRDYFVQARKVKVVSRSAGDGYCCTVCMQMDGSEALPPHENCVSKYGCRCVGIAK